MSDVYVSVIIPSYQSAEVLRKNVGALLGYLDAQSYPYEVIVVDDGSQDGGLTERVAARFDLRYLRHARNLGKGAALRTGMLHANGKYRIFTDADIPYHPDAIERFLHYLDFKEFHMVVGDRTIPQSEYFAEVPLLRTIGSHLVSFLVGRFVAGGWYDTQCGLKGFRADVAEDLFGVSRIDGFAIDVELFYVALKRNYDIKRLPVRLRCQDGNTVKVLRHGLRIVADLFRIVMNYYSGRYQRTQESSSHATDRRTGDKISIAGDYQYRAYHQGRAPQRFWHYAKLLEAELALDVQQGEAILDAGCGSGVLAEILASRHGASVVAVDANPAAIEFATRTFNRPNLTFRLGLVDELDVPDQSYDKIVFLEVIEHLNEDQADQVLSAFYRMLKPGGKLVISTPNGKGLWPLIEWGLDTLKITPRLAGEQHEYLYDDHTLQQKVEHAGFRCVNKRTLNTFAPWLAWLSWNLALIVHRLEVSVITRRGSILLYTFEKPASSSMERGSVLPSLDDEVRP